MCTWLMCYLLAGVVMWIILKNGATATSLRIGMVVQDILVFIVPAMLTAVIITRQPAEFLSVMKRPQPLWVYLVLCALIVSAPAMNVIIAWNQSIQLPESMHDLAQWMMDSEAQAEMSMHTLMGDGSIGSLIVSLLLVGILAGFSEEMFFRGALQRIISSMGAGQHVAVWITAFVFSAVHFQFFGFVPRLLLGAFFGYLVVWSGSLWLPILAHIFNNSIAVMVMWMHQRSNGAINVDSLGTEHTTSDYVLVATSALLTILIVVYLRKKLLSATRNQQE